MLVLVTRPRDQAGATVALLEARGHRALIDPMLRIVPLPPPLLDPAAAAALLLTSANAVPLLPPGLRGLPVYAVGEATAAAARLAGFEVLGTGRDDGRALAELIRCQLPAGSGMLLHPGAAEPRPGLAEDLLRAGYDYRHIPLYRAEPSTALSEDTAANLRKGALDAALFFSPRTAQIWRQLVSEARFDHHLRSVVAACLSEAVAAELRLFAWASLRTAPRRDQGALVGCLDGVG